MNLREPNHNIVITDISVNKRILFLYFFIHFFFRVLTKVLPRVSQKTVTDITTFVDKSGKVGITQSESIE